MTVELEVAITRAKISDVQETATRLLLNFERMQIPKGRKVTTRFGIGESTGGISCRRFGPDPEKDPLAVIPQAVISFTDHQGRSMERAVDEDDCCPEASCDDFTMAERIYKETWPKTDSDVLSSLWTHEIRSDAFAFRTARALSRITTGQLFYFGDDLQERSNRKEWYCQKGAFPLSFNIGKIQARQERFISLVAQMWHGRFNWLKEDCQETNESAVKAKQAFDSMKKEFNLSHTQSLLVLEQFHEPLDRSHRWNIPMRVSIYGGAIGGQDAVYTGDSE